MAIMLICSADFTLQRFMCVDHESSGKFWNDSAINAWRSTVVVNLNSDDYSDREIDIFSANQIPAF
jgi:hypothetical protein